MQKKKVISKATNLHIGKNIFGTIEHMCFILYSTVCLLVLRRYLGEQWF